MDEVLKCETVKLLGKDIENLQNPELGKFLDLIQSIKGNIGHLDLIKSKNCCSVKDNVKGRKYLLQIRRKYLQTTKE